MARCAPLCSADRLFIFINIGFAMYSGALLSTAARLAWDPSTYAWFRFLCAAQYRACGVFVLCTGAALAALAAVAAAGPRRRALHAYCVCVVALALSELAFGLWLSLSLAAWWRAAPEAELARRGMDLLHDLKPALLAVDRYRDVAKPVYDMILEVEAQAPNNVYVIVVFALLCVVLQIGAVVTARRLARRGAALCAEKAQYEEDSEPGDPAEAAPEPPGSWRKHANLRMYTILDKIF